MKDKTKKVIEKVKPSVKLFALDYDGTIFDISDDRFDHKAAFALVSRILKKNKSVAVFSARCVTFLQIYQPLLTKLYSNNNLPTFYFGGGNGSVLYQFSSNGIKMVYRLGLTDKEIKVLVEIIEKIYQELNINYSDLNKKGLRIHKEFFKKNWNGLVSISNLKLVKKHKGKYWAEEAKIAIVLPKNNKTHSKVIDKLQNNINKTLINNKKSRITVVKGDEIFIQVNRSFSTDQKLYSLNKVKQIGRLNDKEVVVFGNMPEDNDKGILIDSKLPFTFTNSNKVIKTQPPYNVNHYGHSPVENVYKTINQFIS